MGGIRELGMSLTLSGLISFERVLAQCFHACCFVPHVRRSMSRDGNCKELIFLMVPLMILLVFERDKYLIH